MNKIGLAPTTLMRAMPMEYVGAAIEAGYDTIGLRLYPSPGMFYSPIVGNPELMRDVQHQLDDAGIQVLEMLTCYLQPETDLDAMRRSLEYAAQLKTPYCLVIGDDPEWNRMVDTFARHCDMAAEFGMTDAIEAPVNTRVVNSLELALKLIDDAGRQNAVLCLDPVQFFRAGHTVDMLKDVDPRLLPYTQICDGTSMTAMAPYCMPGDGMFPLFDLLDALPAGLPLSLEYHLRDPQYTPAQWAKHVLDGTQAFLERYEAREGLASAR
jgi:sugar phosphate isomerase/epimerase